MLEMQEGIKCCFFHLAFSLMPASDSRLVPGTFAILPSAGALMALPSAAVLCLCSQRTVARAEAAQAPEDDPQVAAAPDGRWGSSLRVPVRDHMEGSTCSSLQVSPAKCRKQDSQFAKAVCWEWWRASLVVSDLSSHRDFKGV